MNIHKQQKQYGVTLKGCTGFAVASDKAYQLLVHGQWFSAGTPTSSTTEAGRHD
jgi:hypothetical protein